MVTDQSSQNTIFSSQNTISSSQNTASTIEDFNREHYVDLLNNYLNSRKVSAISLPIQRWKDSSKRTKRRYQGLFKECFYTIIDPFSPGEYDDIFNNICEDDEHQDEDDNGNSKLITALVESYEKSSAWQSHHQGSAIWRKTSEVIIREVMDAPNIIRCMGPAAIIQQYQAYCEENDISLLGSSTMFRILSECSATVRKSLEGLDYFVAEGSRGFQDLQDIVLSSGYPETSNGTELNRPLLEAKRYMKQISRYIIQLCNSTRYYRRN
ncbi:Hypothetical predicted protein [Mytilus galloprovincialis]|uniref:Uncharacterized protein n=1 Tax=Mytilus galloprovincialis TaxID=29158 RepID=A0A8B6D1R4_MYTGA|nr:Hypothetical predicted protein [Mytilus galloprovincialis]